MLRDGPIPATLRKNTETGKLDILLWFNVRLYDLVSGEFVDTNNLAGRWRSLDAQAALIYRGWGEWGPEIPVVICQKDGPRDPFRVLVGRPDPTPATERPSKILTWE